MSDTDARLHALHWAFFVDTLDMEFEDLHQIFLSWCESVPADEMARIMAMGDELFGDNDDDDNIDDDDDDDPDPWNEDNLDGGRLVTDDEAEHLYTEEDIWNDSDSASYFSLN